MIVIIQQSMPMKMGREVNQPEDESLKGKMKKRTENYKTTSKRNSLWTSYQFDLAASPIPDFLLFAPKNVISRSQQKQDVDLEETWKS